MGVGTAPRSSLNSPWADSSASLRKQEAEKVQAGDPVLLQTLGNTNSLHFFPPSCLLTLVQVNVVVAVLQQEGLSRSWHGVRRSWTLAQSFSLLLIPLQNLGLGGIQIPPWDSTDFSLLLGGEKALLGRGKLRFMGCRGAAAVLFWSAQTGAAAPSPGNSLLPPPVFHRTGPDFTLAASPCWPD